MSSRRHFNICFKLHAQVARIILASERQGTNIQTSRNFAKTLFVNVKKILFICSILICDRAQAAQSCKGQF